MDMTKYQNVCIDVKRNFRRYTSVTIVIGCQFAQNVNSKSKYRENLTANTDNNICYIESEMSIHCRLISYENTSLFIRILKSLFIVLHVS